MRFKLFNKGVWVKVKSCLIFKKGKLVIGKTYNSKLFLKSFLNTTIFFSSVCMGLEGVVLVVCILLRKQEMGCSHLFCSDLSHLKVSTKPPNVMHPCHSSLRAPWQLVVATKTFSFQRLCFSGQTKDEKKKGVPDLC